ncbi:MAG: recombination protein RecR [Candidatus Omnitrophica bacterium]|nr:recombination protein RecR [Candidatus Omnitrophota bacterium]
MSGLTASMEALIAALKKLPGVGPRTAERFAFYLLTQPVAVAKELAQSILRVKETVGFCKICFNLADEETCSICRDPGRDRSVVCVVEHPRGIISFEKAGGYKGSYHVLLGALSPLDAIGPKDLRIQELKERIKSGSIQEVILATDSDLEGETTALYLTKELKALSPQVRVSRLAAGLPMGSAIEFADQVTLSRALEGRRPL